MKRYSTESFVELYQHQENPLPLDQARERAVAVRRAMQADDRTRLNSKRRYDGVPGKLLQNGYCATSVSFAPADPCPMPTFQPDPSELCAARVDLVRALNQLPSRQQTIVCGRADGFTLAEIADEVKLSLSRVEELEKASYRQLAALLSVRIEPAEPDGTSNTRRRRPRATEEHSHGEPPAHKQTSGSRSNDWSAGRPGTPGRASCLPGLGSNGAGWDWSGDRRQSSP